MVALESGAIMSARLYHGDEGNTKTVGRSLDTELAGDSGQAAEDADGYQETRSHLHRAINGTNEEVFIIR